MQFNVYRKYDSQFVFRYLLNNLKIFISEDRDKGKFKKLDNFLYNTLGIEDSTYTILKWCINNSYLSVNSTYYNIDFCPRRKYKDTNYDMSQLINLIEYGNLEVSGTHTLSNHLNYIRRNMENLYHLYLARGLK